MLKKVILAFAILSTSLLSAKESFQEVHSFAEMGSYFDEAGEKSLVIFDIDLVLLMPAEPALQMPNMIRHREMITRLFKSHPPEVRAAVLRLMITEFGHLLVERESVNAIQKLQKRGVPTIALTASWTSDDLIERRWRQLADHGIDFSKFKAEEILFEGYQEVFQSCPAYSCGILFTNGESVSKGALLLDFLDRVKCSPQCIIFIDDRKENLDSVGASLTERGIDHLLLWYRGANIYLSQEVTAEEMKRTWHQLTQKAREAVCSTAS
jgi:hypothetical protein